MACLAANAPPSLNPSQNRVFGQFAAPSTEGKLPPGEARGISVARKGGRGSLFSRKSARPCPRSASPALGAILTANSAFSRGGRDRLLPLMRRCTFSAEVASPIRRWRDAYAPGPRGGPRCAFLRTQTSRGARESANDVAQGISSVTEVKTWSLHMSCINF